MQNATKLQDLANTAFEALKFAVDDCSEPTTGGFILAALALVSQIRDELGGQDMSCRRQNAGELCSPI